MVGEAIQDILFHDLKGQTGQTPMVSSSRSAKFTRAIPKAKNGSAKTRRCSPAGPKRCSIIPASILSSKRWAFQSAAQLALFRDYILRAFRNGKSVVTSDKAVLARYGKEIWAAAKRTGQQLRFEACVGGGIPVIRSLS